MRFIIGTATKVYIHLTGNHSFINQCTGLPKSVIKITTCTPNLLQFCTKTMGAVTYDEVKAAGQDKSKLIIDVREPQELQETGVIPGSINIPLGEVESVLKNLTPEKFREKFGRDKPSLGAPIIFSCKAGGRSAKAQQIANNLGFKSALNYSGGWLDWEKNLKSK